MVFRGFSFFNAGLFVYPLIPKPDPEEAEFFFI